MLKRLARDVVGHMYKLTWGGTYLQTKTEVGTGIAPLKKKAKNHTQCEMSSAFYDFISLSVPQRLAIVTLGDPFFATKNGQSRFKLNVICV